MRSNCRVFLHVASAVLTSLVATTPAHTAQGVTDWLNANDFLPPNQIQKAINALPENTGAGGGGVVYVPAGLWYQTRPITLPKNKTVHLLGAGQEVTNLLWTQPDFADSDYVLVRGSNQVIENLSILGTNVSGNARGIVVLPDNQVISGVELRRVAIYQTPSWCLEIVGGTSYVSIQSSVQSCRFNVNKRDGLVKVGKHNVAWSFRDCNFGSTVVGTLFEVDEAVNINAFSSGFQTIPDATQPHVRFKDAVSSGLAQCYFEMEGTSTQPFVKITGKYNLGITVADCYFTRAISDVGKIVEVAADDTVYSLVVINPVLNIPSSSGNTNDLSFGHSSSTANVIGGVLFDNITGVVKVPRSHLTNGRLS